MAICDLCKRIPPLSGLQSRRKPYGPRSTIEYMHSQLAQIRLSAAEGCEFCNLMIKALENRIVLAKDVGRDASLAPVYLSLNEVNRIALRLDGEPSRGYVALMRGPGELSCGRRES